MVDLDSLRETHAKAEAKAKRLRAQADAAEKEANEIETAIRVIERIGGLASANDAGSSATVSETGSLILQYLSFGEAGGKSPKEVHELVSLLEGETMSADLIRTQLWRMAKRGVLESKDGRYWKPQKEEASGGEPKASNSVGPVGREGGYPPSTPEGSIPSGSTFTQGSVSNDTDLDDDVPF